jgi:sterol carrier protein 2
MTTTWVMGVGMVKFQKPGASDPYPKMASDAVRAALADAGLGYESIQQVFAGYVYGDSTAGQRAVYDVGLSGVPIFNVNNNCSTGSTALFMARQAVLAGADCVLAVGFEQMEKGAIGSKYTDRVNPLERHFGVMSDAQGLSSAPPAAQMFGGAGREHQWKYGTKRETFAKIAEKARRHAAKNPYAIFNEAMTAEAVLATPEVFDPLTRAQCCPPTCGAAAAVVVSDAFAKKHGAGRAVRIAAQAMTTDTPESFHGSMIRMVGFDMTARAAREAYRQAGAGPEDVQVIELHDCFTTNELFTYEALGLVREGEGEKLVADEANTFGGRWVVNPSGGLLSKGHPLGATGLAQCAELVWQLRGDAGARQVPGAKLALQHNIGLGGACVVTMYAAS